MKNKTLTIMTIIYSIIAIPIIIYMLKNIIDDVYFLDLFSIFFCLFILLIFALPYILLLFGKKKNDKKLIKGTIIYEVVLIGLIILFSLLLWIAWPSIKKSITSCWCEITDTNGNTIRGCCN